MNAVPHARPVHALIAALAGLSLGAIPRAAAQSDPSGIDFVTVRAAGNPAYDGPDPFGRARGRGGVAYEFKIGRTEISTADWLPFYNTFKARADPVPDSILPLPLRWGAQADPTYTGPGVRYRLDPSNPNAALRPAYEITWRTAARFANWLCHDRSAELSALDSGAYESSSFGYIPGTDRFTDQPHHTPGARYWVPTLDEFMKAAFFDPTLAANGGWWISPNRSDTPLIYGPPPSFGGDGTGQANAGFTLPSFQEYRIPLLSYPSVLSPWGALDLAGGGTEWTEEILDIDNRLYRYTKGSFAAVTAAGAAEADVVFGTGGGFAPDTRAYPSSLRICSAVPPPSTGGILLLMSVYAGRRRRRHLGRHCRSHWVPPRSAWDGVQAASPATGGGVQHFPGRSW